MSSFWNTMQGAGGDPESDLRVPGPTAVGRFQLQQEAFLPSLDVATPGDRTGVWDVLAHPDGSLWFTTYFSSAGRVAPGSGRVTRFPGAGRGLNELALGPDGRVLATRYGFASNRYGSVVVFSPAGTLEAEYRLETTPGVRPAAKSVAWDPLRREIWVNTDLFRDDAGDVGHDVRVLGEDGRERLRLARPEVQFMSFGPDGTGYFAERDGSRLGLRIRPPEEAGSPLPSGRIIILDDAFPVGQDFVQEIRVEPGGRVLVTRWSGRIHVVEPDGSVRNVTLPRPGGRGLYYSAVLLGKRLCATLCDRVSVTCTDLP